MFCDCNNICHEDFKASRHGLSKRMKNFFFLNVCWNFYILLIPVLFLTLQKSNRNYSYVIWNYNVDPWIIRATMVPVLQLNESRQVRCCCCCCCCFLLVSWCILVHVVLNIFFFSLSATMRLFLFVNHVDKTYFEFL